MLPVLKIEREVLQKSLLSVNEDIEKQLASSTNSTSTPPT